MDRRTSTGRDLFREQRVSHDRWLVSYADFITLMFVFVTALYAMSAVDTPKLASVTQSLDEAFAHPAAPVAEVLDQPAAPVAEVFDQPAAPVAEVIDVDPTILEAAALTRELAGLEQQLSDRLGGDIAANRVAVRLDGRGLVISLHEAGAFATGSADLSVGARALIDTVGAAIAPLDNIVRVEGHTDDVPISTARYRSNWELSTARATSVVSYLVEEAGMPSERFAIAGYGEFRPQVPNDSEASRSKNRRVDIVVLTSQTTSSEEPPAPNLEAGDA